jgi:hypothetical protein
LGSFILDPKILIHDLLKIPELQHLLGGAPDTKIYPWEFVVDAEYMGG